MRLHIAFRTTLDQVMQAPAYLRSKGIVPCGPGGAWDIDEPAMLPSMPVACAYFEDPDGHSLE